jgi:hypothetical protein
MSQQFQTVIARDLTTNAIVGIITGLKRSRAESEVQQITSIPYRIRTLMAFSLLHGLIVAY